MPPFFFKGRSKAQYKEDSVLKFSSAALMNFFSNTFFLTPPSSFSSSILIEILISFSLETGSFFAGGFSSFQTPWKSSKSY